MKSCLFVLPAALVAATTTVSVCHAGAQTMNRIIERKTCRAADGVTMVYSAAGAGEPALVFIHGGLANRGFWDGEVRAFAARHRVIAPDLVGHGESGANRMKWGLPEFGADIRAGCTRLSGGGTAGLRFESVPAAPGASNRRGRCRLPAVPWEE